MDSNKKIINNIAEVLKNKGIGEMRPTQEFLDKCETSFHLWKRWVRKSNDPELWQLVVIANYLDCDISELISKTSVTAS